MKWRQAIIYLKNNRIGIKKPFAKQPPQPPHTQHEQLWQKLPQHWQLAAKNTHSDKGGWVLISKIS